MILPDVNILVHAHNADSSVHAAAKAWWDRALAGSEGIGLAWVVLLGFLRITTHRKILLRPLPVAEATARIESWLELPHVHIVDPAASHFSDLRKALEGLGTAGNLTTDAHLATLAQQRGYLLISTDNDFARFPGVRWKNPCA